MNRILKNFVGLYFVVALTEGTLTCAIAQSLSDRELLQDNWTDKQKNHRNLYETSPVTHIVPEFNTITYAARGEKINAVVTPSDTQKTLGRDESLTLTGYTIAPHMAVSLKNIGLGFSAEAGQRRAVYAATSSLGKSGSQYIRQESYLDYRGLGLYLYWIIPQPIKRFTPSLTLGNSSYAVKHQVSTFDTSSSPIKDNGDSFKGYNYNVAHYEVGLNLGFQLLKNFSIVPWAHYDIADASDGTKQADSAQTSETEQSGILRDDLDLFWHSQNRLKYGIDLTVRMFDRVAVHVGGLLGLVAASNYNSSEVTDKTVSLGVSFDQKGN